MLLSNTATNTTTDRKATETAHDHDGLREREIERAGERERIPVASATGRPT
jgi:hypothetical protein